MTVITIMLKPQGTYKINVEQNFFVKEPKDNTLTVEQVYTENALQNPAPVTPDQAVGDFLLDLGLQHDLNLTDIPNSHF